MGPELQPGANFAGFRIVRRLGTGGMGTVYAARHPRLPRDIALKLLQADPSDAGAAARFDREAEVIASLDHPSIVSVLDRGVEQGTAWISIQLVDGQDAASELRQRGQLPVAEVVAYARQVAVALETAHRSGVVHRDVKPANIMISQERPGQPRRALLTDFGISALTTPHGHPQITGRLDVQRATVAFAAPEQLRGESVDGRSDQYSLACTLFALLTGAPPYPGTTGVEVGGGHLNAPVPDVRAARGEVPAIVAAAIARAMSKSADERFPSCLEFAEALSVIPSRRGRTAILATAAILAVGMAVGGLAWANSRGETQASPSPSTVTQGAKPTAVSSASSEIALWKKAQPGIALWPKLFPNGPKDKGFQRMVCAPSDEKTAATEVPYEYALRCRASEDGFGKPTITVDLLSYAPGRSDRALKALDPPQWVPRITSPHNTRMYHFEDPVDGDWILLTFTGDDRSSYHLQVGSKRGEMTYSELYDWVVAAPL
ncbi:serine/threonine-protein kinase [Demetria terragena]|uniref:serine/threonine-protein kinase n=1 Tax=Demetria terragena TaxID=63959 RepID=UPI000382D922|nr:serine/threonine-protein kinase [Demetria terragena]